MLARHSPTFEANLAYRVQTSVVAKLDARDYTEFIRNEAKSDAPAKKWLDGLEREINGLSDNPSRFPIIPEASELGFPYRSFMFHSHRVIYAVHEEKQLVIVHRVYHGARKPVTGQDVP